MRRGRAKRGAMSEYGGRGAGDRHLEHHSARRFIDDVHAEVSRSPISFLTV